MSETIHHTFKGDGRFPSPEAGVNWQLGFDHGYEYAVKNFEWGRKFDPFPGDSNKGWFGNGFAEGVISGRSFVTQRDYPNLSSMSLNSSTGILGDPKADHWYVITFKNGNWIRVDCEK
jgi:hypothetical protein